jgi:hypothetical protein
VSAPSTKKTGNARKNATIGSMPVRRNSSKAKNEPSMMKALCATLTIPMMPRMRLRPSPAIA